MSDDASNPPVSPVEAEPRPESSGEVAVAETLAAADSEPDGTRGTAPPVRLSGRQSILPFGTNIGRYVLAERIGAGGMGNVYRAHDPKLDREIAVKLVATREVAAAQQYLEREAQAMAKLSHPNVATVHDIGNWNGQIFIAMELCPDGSLATWLASPRPWREVIGRFVAAGRGLAAAHKIGLVHRDFKPDNVLIGADGLVKVSDFGLVRSSTEKLSTGSNPDGTIEGTPAYMAPEQLTGGEVDERADQFAYAVSVWEGVCGGRPFQPEVGGRNMIEGMLRAIRGRRLMRSTTSAAPHRVLKILERALAEYPAGRWPSIDALVDALERAANPSRVKWVVLGLAAAAAVAGITAVTLRVLAAPPDISGTTHVIERSLVPIYLAAGDLARTKGTGTGDRIFIDANMMENAVVAFDKALAISNDNEIRPRLAQALMSVDKCSDAVNQLGAYFRLGGKSATSEHINMLSIEPSTGAPKVEPIDLSTVLRIQEDCEQRFNLPELPEDIERVAMTYWRTGDFDNAIKALERAYLRSHDPRFLKLMGDVRRSEPNCDEAKRYYEEYIAVETRAPQSWLDQVRETSETCGKAEKR